MNGEGMDWSKGLIPAVVQHAESLEVLMLGYMNAEALERTLECRRVTFFSRSRDRLWTKGETSGNFLELIEIREDCDRDTLLVRALPAGPTCHRGTPTCFDAPGVAPAEPPATPFLGVLDAIIAQRQEHPDPASYTHQLFSRGIDRIAQKLGEEAVELVIAAVNRDTEGVLDESADLFYHFLVTLRARGLGLEDVARRLRERHSARE